jgi:hypothetical protein
MTDSMELRLSWEAASCAATQEFPNILWNPKVHYGVEKSPPLVPIVCHINPVYTISSYLSKIHLHIIHAPMTWSSKWSLSSRHSHQVLYAFLTCPMHATRPANLVFLYLIVLRNYTWRRVQVMKLLIMQFSPASCHFIPLRPKKLPQHPVLRHPQSVFLP